MKRSFWYMVAVIAASMMFGCNEGKEPNDTPVGGTGEYGEGPYTLVVDKETIEANGLDVASFSVLDAAGNDLCKGDESNKVYIQNITEDLSLGRRVHSFNSIVNGTYEFSATFKGNPTENTVTVTAQNRVDYEKYKQMVCLYDLTSVSCTACPIMTSTLEKAKEGIWGDQMILMAVHGDFGGVSDPFAIPQGSTDLANMMKSYFEAGGFPTVVYDLNDVVNGTHGATEIGERIRNQIVEFPATCGVKISKAAFDNGSITIEAAMTSTKDGEYDLGYALLGDGLTYEGGTEEDGVYDDVVITVSPNFIRMQKDSKFTATAGKEQAKSWTISGLGNANPDRLRVVVFALREVDGMCIVDNANVCDVNSSADYMLNE